MRKIIVKNFGPVSNVQMNLDKRYNLLIGPQASGKSTLAKTIYFCRKTRDYLVDFLLDASNFVGHPNELYVSFLKYIRKTFMACFGTTKHLDTFEIKYFFNENKGTYVSFGLNVDGYVRVEFSKKKEIQRLIEEAYVLYKEQVFNNGQSFIDRYNNETQKMMLYRKHFIEETNELFNDDSDILYIPAGRSVLSTFSEQLYDVNVANMDSLMQEFISLIRSTRNKFNMPLNELVENYTKTVKGQIHNANVKTAIDIIEKILKGNYVCGRDGERIYFDVDKWVKLMYASSGQQESLWTVMLLFSYILEQRKAFIVLEEPEAHLFPEAQRNIVELIALFQNATDSSIFITTHSPYILTSSNLLVHSFIVENNGKIPSTEKKIISKNCRINPKEISCNMIKPREREYCVSIINNDMGLINAYEIDNVSNIINEETENLIALEMKYDL